MRFRQRRAKTSPPTRHPELTHAAPVHEIGSDGHGESGVVSAREFTNFWSRVYKYEAVLGFRGGRGKERGPRTRRLLKTSRSCRSTVEFIALPLLDLLALCVAGIHCHCPG